MRRAIVSTLLACFLLATLPAKKPGQDDRDQML
jgi:hypothetical protein